MIGLYFLSSALPLINIYVCTKFHFNPFCTFQDMARTHTPIMTNTQLRRDNSINIHDIIMVLVFCPSSHCHLAINQVSFQSIQYFSRYGPDRHKYEKWLRGDNTVNIQGRFMVIVVWYCFARRTSY